MIYWDTSAIIRFMLKQKTSEISGVTRTHTLAELFSALTGRGWRETMPGGMERQRRMGLTLAANSIKDAQRGLTFIDLTQDEVLMVLQEARDLGAQGGRIHDLLHARAAEKAKVDEFWTTDENDFKGLLTSIPIKQLADD